MKRIYSAFLNSMSGLKFLYREEAFRQEIFYIAPALFVCMLCFNASLLLKMYLFSSFILVLIVECINTSIEKAVDRISKEKHDLSKIIKDVGSTAVFFSLVHLAIVFVFTVINSI